MDLAVNSWKTSLSFSPPSTTLCAWRQRSARRSTRTTPIRFSVRSKTDVGIGDLHPSDIVKLVHRQSLVMLGVTPWMRCQWHCIAFTLPAASKKLPSKLQILVEIATVSVQSWASLLALSMVRLPFQKRGLRDSTSGTV